MAEFGIKATQLSDPQGKGATPVAPVPGLDVGSIVKAGASLFSALTEKEPDALSKYSEKLQSISQGIDNGELSQTRGLTEARKTHAEFAGRYPQFTKEIKAIHESFMSGTSIGVAQDEEKTTRELRNADIKDAAKEGWDIPYGASTEATDAIIAAAKAKRRNREALKDFVEAARFKREQKTWNDSDVDRESKQQIATLLASSAGSYIDGFNAQASALAASIGGNPEKAAAAQAQLASYYSKIKGEIAAIASYEPGLASNYKDLFDELYATNKKMLDPVNMSEDKAKLLKAELENVQNRIKLTALKSPSVQQGFAINTLIGQPVIINALGSAAQKDVAVLLSGDTDSPNRPPVIGNPEVEKNVLEASRVGLAAVLNGSFVAHKERSEKEAVNMANNILREVGSIISNEQKLNPQTLNAALDWASRSEVGATAKAGKLDLEARLAAQKVFEIGMQQPLVAKIDEKLKTKSAINNTPVIDNVAEVSFDGASVKFTFKPGTGNYPVGVGSTQKDMKSTEEIVTKLVKAAAHMQGHTDYQAAWLEIRPKVFPSLYVSPTPLKKGQTVKAGKDTYEYLGGPDGRQSSWRKLPSATE